MKKYFSIFLLFLLGCRPGPQLHARQWQTMGTAASVMWRAAEDQPFNGADQVSNVFARVEKSLNRFDAQSELSRLAPLPDVEILEKCDAEMRLCYETAFKLREESGGAFDPRWRGEGTLDLGAIAKGFAVDLAVETINVNISKILIDLGGNLKVAGSESWKVGVANSDRSLTLTNGMACATSAEYFRGKHIFDARTGLAVSNDLVSVTIVHPNSAMLADGLSTVCFILGETEGEAFLRKFHPEATAVWVKRQ